MKNDKIKVEVLESLSPKAKENLKGLFYFNKKVTEEFISEIIDLAIQKARADTLDSVGEVLKRYYNHLWNTTFFQDRWKELSSLSDKDGEKS